MSRVSCIRILAVRCFTNSYILVWIYLNLSRNPLAQLEEEKREHDNKMKKMETEMEQVFEMKVREKRQKLKDSEADVSETCYWYYFLLNCTVIMLFTTT